MLSPEVTIASPTGCTVAELRAQLIARYPAAGDVLKNKRALSCVGDTLVRDEHVLNESDTVEFLSPVSGG